MRKHHISNGALAAAVVVAVVLMWLVNRPDHGSVPERASFRGFHASGSVADNIMMSDFTGIASQTDPVMPSRALGIFRLTSQRKDDSLLCLQGGKPAQSALVEELSGCSGVLTVNVILRFRMLSAALRDGDQDEAGYSAERLEQSYALLRVADPKFDKPLQGWSALHDAIQTGDYAKARGLLTEVYRACLPCQGPEGARYRDKI